MAKDSIKVRLPGLGGQGAVTAAHIAATAADTDGYYAVSNPFFGAEKLSLIHISEPTRPR